MSDKKFPDPDDIQKEFESFVKGKFGQNIQVFTQALSKAVEQTHSVSEEQENPQEVSPAEPTTPLAFNYKPKEVKAFLDRYVVDQDEAKKALAISICDHYNHVKSYIERNCEEELPYSKQNVLILGPTGVGKTYLIKQIAKLIGVPFVKADATRFSETGYMGANVDDLIKDLVTQANGDLEAARFGIVYLDETDKLATRSRGSMARDVSGRGVQLGLLKIMEEADVDLNAGNDPASQMQAFMQMQKTGNLDSQVINTRFILFVVSGAFNGLDEAIQKRLNQKNIGLANHSKNQIETEKSVKHENPLHLATTEDLVQYGFEPEFIGRLPVRVACNPLSVESLFRILTESENSILDQYIASFKAYGIDLKFEKPALMEIAKLAKSENTGARALMTIFERTLRSYKFELPSTSITSLKVDKKLVDDPENRLAKLLKKNRPIKYERATRLALENVCQDFYAANHLRIQFDDHAAFRIEEIALAAVEHQARSEKERIEAIVKIAEGILSHTPEGLRLVQQNTQQDDFILTKAFINRPTKTLEEWVKVSFTKQQTKH